MAQDQTSGQDQSRELQAAFASVEQAITLFPRLDATDAALTREIGALLQEARDRIQRVLGEQGPSPDQNV